MMLAIRREMAPGAEFRLYLLHVNFLRYVPEAMLSYDMRMLYYYSKVKAKATCLSN